MHALLTEMAGEHEVHAIYSGMRDADGEVDGIHIHERRNTMQMPPFYFHHFRIWRENNSWLKVLAEFVAQKKPDIMLTAMHYAPASVEVAKTFGIPAVFFFHGYMNFCPIDFANGIHDCNRRCWFCVPQVNSPLYNALKHVQDILQYPFIRKMLGWHERAIKGANVVIANSQYVADLARKWFGIDAEVVYPFMDLQPAKLASHRVYTTLINPSVPKGVEIFIEIAERLRDRDFLSAGTPPSPTIRRKLTALRNLQYIGRVEDIKTVYSKTRVLLIPSIWAEGLGMVAVEAMANGIPCIVSNRGALPEAVANAGVVIHDLFNIDAWVNAIVKLDSDKEYEELSQRGKKQVEKFHPKAQYEKFKRILQAIT